MWHYFFEKQSFKAHTEHGTAWHPQGKMWLTHFLDNIFKCIFLNENVCISFKISLKFVPMGPIKSIPALVEIMAWRRTGDKPLSEPVMVILPTHIWVIQPQWVKENQLCHSFCHWIQQAAFAWRDQQLYNLLCNFSSLFLNKLPAALSLNTNLPQRRILTKGMTDSVDHYPNKNRYLLILVHVDRVCEKYYIS